MDEIAVTTVGTAGEFQGAQVAIAVDKGTDSAESPAQQTPPA
ncbi:hypothetical protein ACWZHB_21625 [Nocardia sp. FBN12]